MIQTLTKPVTVSHIFQSLKEIELLYIKKNKDEAGKKINELLKNTNQTYPGTEKWINKIITKMEPKPVSNLDLPPVESKQYDKFIDVKVYNELLPYVQLAWAWAEKELAEQEDIQAPPHDATSENYALKLSVLFNDKKTALEYLTKFFNNQDKNQENKLTIHDACGFILPSSECNIKTWQKLAKTNMSNQQFMEILPYAEKIETLFKTHNLGIGKAKLDSNKIQDQNKKISEIHKKWKVLERHHGNLTTQEKQEHETLTKELLELNKGLVELSKGTPLENATINLLNAYCEYYQSQSPAYNYFIQNGLTKKSYNKFITLKPVNDDKEIPNILIDGESVGYPGFYFKKLDVLNEKEAALACCLGKKSSCCQSLSGELGEPCVIHGLTRPDGGFYVLCKGDVAQPKVEDELYAQSWVWRSGETLVFDSIETPKAHADKIEMIKDFYLYFSTKVVSEPSYHIDKIQTGAESGISKQVGLFYIPEALIKDYDGYRDSNTQLMLAEKNRLYYLFGQMKCKQGEEINKLVKEQISFEMNKCNRSLLGDIFSIALSNQSIPSEMLNGSLLGDIIFYALQNNMELLEQLLAQVGEKIDVNQPDSSGYTLLMKAKLINLLLRHGADPCICEDFGSISPLSWAVENANYKLFSTLIEMGVDVNKQDSNGNSPLMHATMLNQGEEFITQLLDRGADLHIKNNNNEDVVSLGDYSNLEKMFLHILRKNKNIDLNALLKDHGTLLCWAIEHRAKQLFYTLLEMGVDVNVGTSETESPLILTAKCGDQKMLEHLLEKGANINVRSNLWDRTALMIAIEYDKPEIVTHLLEKGADVNLVSSDKETALIIATKAGHREMVAQLIEKGANVNYKGTIYSRTPLMIAVIEKKPEVVAQLLFEGADVNIKDIYGKTAYDYATLEIKKLFDSNILALTSKLTSFEIHKAKASIVNTTSTNAEEENKRELTVSY